MSFISDIIKWIEGLFIVDTGSNMNNYKYTEPSANATDIKHSANAINNAIEPKVNEPIAPITNKKPSIIASQVENVYETMIKPKLTEILTIIKNQPEFIILFNILLNLLNFISEKVDSIISINDDEKQTIKTNIELIQTKGVDDVSKKTIEIDDIIIILNILKYLPHFSATDVFNNITIADNNSIFMKLLQSIKEINPTNIEDCVSVYNNIINNTITDITEDENVSPNRRTQFYEYITKNIVLLLELLEDIKTKFNADVTKQINFIIGIIKIVKDEPEFLVYSIGTFINNMIMFGFQPEVAIPPTVLKITTIFPYKTTKIFTQFTALQAFQTMSLSSIMSSSPAPTPTTVDTSPVVEKTISSSPTPSPIVHASPVDNVNIDKNESKLQFAKDDVISQAKETKEKMEFSKNAIISQAKETKEKLKNAKDAVISKMGTMNSVIGSMFGKTGGKKTKKSFGKHQGKKTKRIKNQNKRKTKCVKRYRRI